MSFPRTTAVALLGLLASPMSATAATSISSPTTPWQGGVVPAADGTASYCAIESRYRNGLTLSIAQNRKADITLVLLVPGLPVAAGAEWPVKVLVDGVARPVTAHVTDVSDSGAVIAMPYGTVAADGARLAKAAVLSIVSKADRANFATKGLPDALAALATCATDLH